MPNNWSPSSPAVTAILPAEMAVIAAMHAVAQKYHIVLACNECRRPFLGLNDGTSPVLAIACGCRELRAHLSQALGRA